jgi:glycosyltransferase involved in cell wall biosynthesis
MVGISLLTLVPGVVGGSETYARELCRTLARVGELEYVVFATRLTELGSGLEIEHIHSYRASTTAGGRAAAMARAAFFGGATRRELRLDRLQAIHFPLTVMLPPVERPPAVTTMHDLQHETHPRFFSRAELAYRRFAYGRTARASRLLIAPSEYVRGTLVERLRVPPERVRALDLGIDHERFSPGPVRGRVSPEELDELYRTAAALVFPSLYEGFGAPPLEAMACGCPVACSDVCSLPEVAGDAAVLFDAGSAEAIAAGVERALADETLPARGLERAARFTWEATARAHEAVYREVAADALLS